MALTNVELVLYCNSQHLRIGTASIKLGRVAENSKQGRENK